MTGAHRSFRIRWWILLFMFVFALISFVQRTSLGVAADEMLPALHWNELQLGWLTTAYFITYTSLQIPAGVAGQVWGSRRVYVAVGVLGLIATAATPILSFFYRESALFVGMLGAQLLLGVALSPVFPVFAAVVEKWFPTRQWALANGLQTCGMLAGGAVTPPLITKLTAAVGWRWALLLVTLPVLLVTLGWAWYGRSSPKQHAAVSTEELAELDTTQEKPKPLTLRRLLSIAANRDVLLLAISYLLMNYSFYLLTYWSYRYLVDVRGFHGIEGGAMGMIPWLGAAAGAALGGQLSDRFGKRFGLKVGYRIVPVVCLPLVGVCLLATNWVSAPYVAVLMLAAAFAAVEINEGAYWAATMSIARADTGAATGVLNTGGNLGGILCQPIVAVAAVAGAWNAAFAIGAVLALLAAALWLFVDAERPLRG